LEEDEYANGIHGDLLLQLVDEELGNRVEEAGYSPMCHRDIEVTMLYLVFRGRIATNPLSLNPWFSTMSFPKWPLGSQTGTW